MKKISVYFTLCIALISMSFQPLSASAIPHLGGNHELQGQIPPEVIEKDRYPQDGSEEHEAEALEIQPESDQSQPVLMQDGRGITVDGLWYVESDSTWRQLLDGTSDIQTIFGPDQYGYTWEDGYLYAWVDVSDGTDTGIHDAYTSAGPITIGFDFKYYTNTYAAVYISPHGYISFNDDNLSDWQSYIPDPALPNDTIAPMWGPTESVNYVRYKTDGVTPNRRMIIEWNEKKDDEATEIYTFEVILHENGDIVFQYKALLTDGGGYCTSSGIEDEDGSDGLTLKDMCDRFATGEAARIYRPEPSARLGFLPVRQGGFASLILPLEYPLTIRNLGDYGTDTFDLQVASDWPVEILQNDGVTLLTDTDGDGAIDTGPLTEGSSISLIARIIPPQGSTIGDANSTRITATSTIDPILFKNSEITVAFPAPFTQAFFDSDAGAGIYLVHPNMQIESLPDWWTPSMGVVETAHGNIIYADQGQRYNQVLGSWTTSMQVIAFDNYGSIITPSHTLSIIEPSVYEVWESDPALAAAPDGNVGILWKVQAIDTDNSKMLENIIFAIIDETGNLVHGPINLTNNTVMGAYSDGNIPIYIHPNIAVTEDGRFAVSFQRMIFEAGTNYGDIFFGIHNGDGSEYSPLTNVTRGTASSNMNYSPALNSLSGNRFFLMWESDDYTTPFAVFDSTGALVKSITYLAADISSPDVVQLSDGKIFIAGIDDFEGIYQEVHYLILNGESFETLTGLTPLINPYSSGKNYAVSVTRDQNSHAILTWDDTEAKNLYYALVGSNGEVATQPIIYRSSSEIFLDVSDTGYGNSTYSSEINPFTSCEAVTSIPVQECYALQALYAATGGDNWINNNKWFEIDVPDTWFGVTVIDGYVTEINLSSNQLIGTIHPELGSLSHLATLSLDRNQLTGAIPSELGNLSSLIMLDLYRNQLTGSIPPELGNLTNLASLSLYTNQLTGSIPTELGNLIHLANLSLYNNQLTGAIPPELGNLTSLSSLSLDGNQLSGSIPASLGNLSNLYNLTLNSNELSGPIPAELGNLSNLMYLTLYYNQLSGPIPATLGNLSNLYLLYLDGNQLTGSIPPDLGSLTGLAALSLSNNLLSGSIPSELGKLIGLGSLTLDSNLLTGAIPAELGDLGSMVYLSLARNQLSGSIPTTIGNLSNLVYLDLSNNQLTGPIPPETGSLVSLIEMDLSSNALSGDVPASFTNLVNLCEPDNFANPCYGYYQLDLGYNHLKVPAPEPPADFLAIKDPDWYLTQAVEETISGDTGATLLSNDGAVEILVPPDAVSGEITLLFEPQPYPDFNWSFMVPTEISFELTAWDAEEQPMTTFAEPIVITLHYDGMLLGSLPEASLRLLYWDDSRSTWVDAVTTCPGGEYTRDFTADTLSLPVCHLTEFGLFGMPIVEIYLPVIMR